jgi:hypothetical protein
MITKPKLKGPIKGLPVEKEIAALEEAKANWENHHTKLKMFGGTESFYGVFYGDSCALCRIHRPVVNQYPYSEDPDRKDTKFGKGDCGYCPIAVATAPCSFFSGSLWRKAQRADSMWLTACVDCVGGDLVAVREREKTRFLKQRYLILEIINARLADLRGYEPVGPEETEV